MNKGLLERFITKYNLGGAAESVLISADAGSVSTKFITDDKNAVGFVKYPEASLEAGEYAVYDTAQFRSLLAVLEDTISVKVKKKADNTPVALDMSDGSTKVTAVLAAKENIPAAPGMKNVPPFEVVIDLDLKSVNTFIRAKGALPEVDTFTVLTNKDKVSLVIGHSDQNTNRVTIDVQGTVKEDISPISFSAKYFKDILVANKELKSGKLEVSSKGLAHITFELSDGFEVNYYLVKVG
jgi:hypothetical protein